MSLKDLIAVDHVRALFNEDEFADALASYTTKDLEVGGGDVTINNVPAIVDNGIDLDREAVIDSAVELIIPDGLVTTVDLLAHPDRFRHGETLLGSIGGATVVYLGRRRGWNKPSILFQPGDTPLPFVAGEVLTGLLDGATATVGTPGNQQTIGPRVAKAGDEFTTLAYRWRVEGAVHDRANYTHTVTARRGAPI